MKIVIKDKSQGRNSQIEFELFEEPLSHLIIEENYTDKSIAVYGSTKEFKSFLQCKGGRFCRSLRNLNGIPGWTFSKRNFEEVKRIVEIINGVIDNDGLCINLINKSTFNAPLLSGRELKIVSITEGSFHLIGDADLFEEELTTLGCRKEYDHENNENVWYFTRNKYNAVNALVKAMNKLM